MWSKTKQVLESRLSDDLKGRVVYGYSVYRNGGSECQVMSIVVDGETWFWPELYKTHSYDKSAEMDVIKRTGYVGNSWGEAMRYVHEFVNILSIDEAIASDNYFIRLLALLDYRLGKRRIRKMAAHVEDEPEWFRKWIMLRLGKRV